VYSFCGEGVRIIRYDEKGAIVDIAIEKCRKDGMYLFFPDGTMMDLSRERVIALGDVYWNDPQKLAADIRDHDDFKTCSVCPNRGKKVLCSAMKPLLPFLEEMERFTSCDIVGVVYVRQGKVQIWPEVAIQYALQYVTDMALFDYCEDAKVYRAYFRGIDPLMPAQDAACRIFLNMFWLEGGDREKVTQKIDEMSETILIMTQSCVKRLNVMCRSDAFMNAYVNSEAIFSGLSSAIKPWLDEYFFPASR